MSIVVLRNVFLRFSYWLLIASPCAPGSGAAATFTVEPTGDAVDPTVVLRIGALEVSQYAVDKNFRRFVAGRPMVDPSELRTWFELFVARQAVIAAALRDGYDQRPEVRSLVDAMERHMLSQPEGPFYHALYPSPLSDDELIRQYARTGRVADVVAVRVPAPEASRILGADWGTSAPEEKRRRLSELRSRPDVFFYEGSLQWTGGGFPEFAESIALATADSWFEQRQEGNVTVAYVRSVQAVPLPPFDVEREGFAGFVRERQKSEFRRKRREQVLTESNLQFENDAGHQLVRCLQDVPRDSVDLPDGPMQAILTLPLARCRLGEDEIVITVAAWRDFYNRLFLRLRPVDLTTLATSVQDMVMMEWDVRAARERGIDQAPRFQEDRRNFLHFQALDLYEKERLMPDISISDAELEDWYRAHRSDFLAPVSATGRLLHFESEPDAHAWMAAGDHRLPPEVASIPGLKSAGEIEISRERPLAGLEQLTEFLLSQMEGMPTGPHAVTDEYIVFLKQSTVTDFLSLSVARDDVRRALMRQKLDAAELDQAREWNRSHPIDDRIPYARYGIKGHGSEP